MSTLSSLGFNETDFSITAVQATLAAVRHRLTRMNQSTSSEYGELTMDYSQLALYAEQLSGLLLSRTGADR